MFDVDVIKYASRSDSPPTDCTYHTYRTTCTVCVFTSATVQGTCHLTSGTGKWCTLELGDTIQVDHNLWLDSLHLVSPKSGAPALSMKQLYSQLWMTNITMNGNGSPDAAGIDLNGHLFAESTIPAFCTARSFRQSLRT